MANIKKSFNFRNGVQVDNDNFIVNANGLVGIGSTIPTESLDVAGNVRIRGILYADSIAGEIIKTSADAIGNFDRVNIGITSITSGIVTASTGIVTYYGDGSNLQGLPTSQWIDADPALNEYTSIYSAGNVGIATTNPIYTLQIGTESDGVGISSDGDVYIGRYLYVNGTGISTFSGNLYVSGTGISTFVGVLTAYSLSGFGTDIIGIDASNISAGTLDNERLASDINKSTGIATFKEFHGDLVGIASTARGLTTDANIDIVSIVSDYSNLGVTTVSSLYSSGNIGFGTELPNSSVQLRKTSNATLEVTSDTNASRIIIGRKNYNSNFNVSNSFGIIKFGNTESPDFNGQSTEDSLDIINYAPGNVNYYIRPETTQNLKFNWINYSTNTILASLTNEGKLGIGKTNPSETFEVVGTSTITSHSFVGGDFKAVGDINGNTLNITGSSTLNSATFNDKVGIFANSPNYSLQIGSSLNADGTSGTGVGIGSTTGNITSSGTVKALKFVGVGSEITLINPANISSGTLGNLSINATTGIITASKFVGVGSEITLIDPSNISSGTLGDISINTTTGIITASKFVGIGSELTFINPANISSGTISNVDINTTGIVTASSFSGNVDGSDIVGTIGNVDVNTTGIVTASSFSGKINPSDIISGTISNSVNYEYSVGIGTTVPKGPFQVNFYSTLTVLNSTSVNAGVSKTINDFYTDSCISTEYLLSFNLNENYQTQKLLVLNDSVNAFSTDYSSVIYNPNKIATLNVSVTDSGIVGRKLVNLNLLPESGMTGILTYRFVRNTILLWDPN